jgi:hypothetical protein
MPGAFFTEYGGGGAKDLDDVFNVDTGSPAGGTTGFYDGVYWGADLAQIYSPRSAGDDIGYDTGFVALDGRDLRQWFAKKGTTFIDIPVGAGIAVQCNGYTLLTGDGVTNNVGGSRGYIQWSRDSAAVQVLNTDGADFNVPCPATGRGLGNIAPILVGGFNAAARYRIPPNSTWRITFEVSNLGTETFDVAANASGVIDSGWRPFFSGNINWCNINDPWASAANFVGFAPPAGFNYCGAYLYADWNAGGSRILLSAGSGRSPATNHPGWVCYATRIA